MMLSLWDLLSENHALKAQVAEKQRTIDLILERNAELQAKLMHKEALAVLN